VAGDRGVEPCLALVEAEAVLAEFEIFFNRPAQPCCPDQPGLGQQLAFGYEAVVKGQLAGPQVAADQQVVARRQGTGFLSIPSLANVELIAGSSTFGMLCAMPVALRRRATYVSSLGRLAGRPDEFSLFFKQAVLAADIAHLSSIAEGHNPVGFVLSGTDNPEKTLAMFPGIAHKFSGCDLEALTPTMLIIDAHELKEGDLAIFLDRIINSDRWNVALSLGDSAVLRGELCQRIRSYVFERKLKIICGNQDEYRTLFPEFTSEIDSPEYFAGHPVRYFVRYALATFGDRGMAAHWAGQFCTFANTPLSPSRIINTSGAGDTAAGSFIAGALLGQPVSGVLFSADCLARRVLRMSGSRIIA